MDASGPESKQSFREWLRDHRYPVVVLVLFVITGMIVSLACMTAIQLLPKLPWTRDLWMRLVGTEIFWPWYTLIGVVITLLTAWLARRFFLPANPPRAGGPDRV